MKNGAWVTSHPKAIAQSESASALISTAIATGSNGFFNRITAMSPGATLLRQPAANYLAVRPACINACGCAPMSPRLESALAIKITP